jgi:HK97 family phage portal protein
MKFEPAKPSNEDQQFLESRRFQVEEIARIFRIPPHMIGHLDRATFSNIESQSLDYVKNTLMAWLELWEAALKRDLLREGERSRGQYIQFDTQRILRGTQKERYEAHQIALTNGIKSFNEVRKEEGLNPVAGGDQLMRPLNMGFVGQPDPGAADQSGDNTDE